MRITYRHTHPQFQPQAVEGASGLTIQLVRVEPERTVTYEIADGTVEPDLDALDIYMADLGYTRV